MVLVAMLSAVSLSAGCCQILPLEIPVSPDETYEVTISAALSKSDAESANSVATCYFSFTHNGLEVPAEDSLVAAALKRDDYTVMEFLHPDCANQELGNHRWFLQVKVPGLATRMRIECKPRNLLVHAQFDPIQVVRLPSEFLQVDNRVPIRKNFRLIDGADALTAYGRIADQSARAVVTVNVEVWVRMAKVGRYAGVETRTVDCPVDAEGRFKTTIPMPPGAYGGCCSIASMSPIAKCCVHSSFLPRTLANQDKPLSLQYDVEGCSDVVVATHLFSPDASMVDSPKAVVVRAECVDAEGRVLPIQELPVSSTLGPYWYCSAGFGSAVSRRKLKIPPGAQELRLRVSKFWQKSEVVLERMLVRRCFADVPPVELAPKDSKTAVVEWFGGKAQYERILNRQDTPRLFISLLGSIMGSKAVSESSEKFVAFTGLPGIAPINERIDWSENPFDNLTWQMFFSTGYWIPVTGLRAADYFRHVKTYWQSFFRHNKWPKAANKMVYVDHASAARVEALLLTLFGTSPHAGSRLKIPSLWNELAKDEEFRTQLLNQLRVDVELIYHHLNSRMYRVHNHNLIMSQVLLEFAQCFRDYEFSRRYSNMALVKIVEQLNLMAEPDGFIREQSTNYHHWMVTHFADIYSYLKTVDIVGNEMLEALRHNLARFFVVDMQLATPTGISALMGDGALRNIVMEDRQLLDKLPEIQAIAMKEEINPRFLYLPESGIVVFRDAENSRYLMIDLSQQVKEHGHRDLGSWQYFSHEVGWVQDLGGPFKYGTSVCRNFARSDSHTVLGPRGRSQSSGEAYRRRTMETPEAWVIEFSDNVYGLEYGHRKRFVVLKDVSAFLCEDFFTSRLGLPHDYVGRIIAGPEVAFDGQGARWTMTSRGKRLNVEVDSAGLKAVECQEQKASRKPQEYTPVKALSYIVEGAPDARSSVLVFESEDAKMRLMKAADCCTEDKALPQKHIRP